MTALRGKSAQLGNRTKKEIARIGSTSFKWAQRQTSSPPALLRPTSRRSTTPRKLGCTVQQGQVRATRETENNTLHNYHNIDEVEHPASQPSRQPAQNHSEEQANEENYMATPPSRWTMTREKGNTTTAEDETRRQPGNWAT